MGTNSNIAAKLYSLCPTHLQTPSIYRPPLFTDPRVNCPYADSRQDPQTAPLQTTSPCSCPLLTMGRGEETWACGVPGRRCLYCSVHCNTSLVLAVIVRMRDVRPRPHAVLWNQTYRAMKMVMQNLCPMHS